MGTATQPFHGMSEPDFEVEASVRQLHGQTKERNRLFKALQEIERIAKNAELETGNGKFAELAMIAGAATNPSRKMKNQYKKELDAAIIGLYNSRKARQDSRNS